MSLRKRTRTHMHNYKVPKKLAMIYGILKNEQINTELDVQVILVVS